jgi:D-alanyl-D-alanine carboxypeptidase/D-alanyl-D-alanine-endopeptidase (penicillin-binding protein 4)
MPAVPLAPRLLVPLAVAAALLVPARAGATPPLDERLAQALVVPHIALARSGAAVVDLASGESLFVHNAGASLAPASNEKLPITYAALSGLGSSFRIETQVLGEGQLVDGVWRGDVVLKGFGDPTLSSSDVRTLARGVRAAGVLRIAGAVVGDETWFDARRTAPGWKSRYFINESPPLSALVVDRARYGRTISTQPALAAASLFRDALRAAGIAVDGSVKLGVADASAQLLGWVESAPVASIVRQMDLDSDNFTAEMLLKELAAEQTGLGTTAAGAALVTTLLGDAGVPLRGVRIVDGSGLSLYDRLTANAIVALLQTMWLDPTVRPYVVRALPVAGISGTLDDRLRTGPARGAVFAKTGTTSRASALSGFVRDRYAFAVVQNGSPVSSWWARKAQDRFVTVLASS